MKIFLKRLFENKKPRHLFFVPSPVVELIVAAYIEELKIDHQDVLIVSLRKYKLGLLKNKVKRAYFPLIERIFYRLFLISFEGLFFRFSLGLRGYQFLLYVPWDMPQYFNLRNLSNCIGQVYLEEGQLSHRQISLYSRSKSIREERKRLKLWRDGHIYYLKRNHTSFTKFYNNGAIGYIGLTKDSFPQVSKEKKLIVDISNNLTSSYCYKTIGVKHIGIMPAPRRLAEIGFELVIDKFVEKLPSGSLIKLHPGFEVNAKLLIKIEQYLKIRSKGNIELCPNGTIIEMEMLKNKKVLYGPLTSLKRYADFFGSKFIDLEVY